MIITNEMVGIAENAYDNAIDEHTLAIRAAIEAVAPALIAQGMQQALGIARRTLIWSADQEAKFVDALCDAGMS